MFLQRIATAAILGGPVLASFFFPPPDPGPDPDPPYGIPCCLFRETTGIPCPLCGLTRSFVSLSHGNVERAFRYHPLGPIVYLAFSLGAIAAMFPRRRGGEPGKTPPSRWPFRIFLAVAGAFLIAWVAKLCWFPRGYW